jgi:hypothetical protein
MRIPVAVDDDGAVAEVVTQRMEILIPVVVSIVGSVAAGAVVVAVAVV